MSPALEALAALRDAYPNAEEWMLEGVRCSLDAQRGDGRAVRETISSFLGPVERETLDALAGLWGGDVASEAASEAREGSEVPSRGGASTEGSGGGGRGGRRERAPARETRAVRFVEARRRDGNDKSSRDGTTLRPGDALRPGDLFKSCVNCLSCGRVYDLRARDGIVSRVALEFLESGGRCEHCGEYVEVTLADGVTRFRGDGRVGGDDGTTAASDADVGAKLGRMSLASSTSADEERDRAAAVAAKDRLVHFDKTSAKRTTVIDDQSEWYDIDGNAWLDEKERAELKRQAREMEEAAEEAKRKARTTWTLDLVGRKVIAPPSESTETTSDDRASDAALAAAKAIRAALATNEELAHGGGGGAASAAETARELERRVFADPRVSTRPSFLAAAPSPDAPHRATKTKRSDAFAKGARETSRVLDDDPFHTVYAELAALGFAEHDHTT